MAYKTGNPALNKKTFENTVPDVTGNVMTLNGVTVKSLFLLAVAVGSGIGGWILAARSDVSNSSFWTLAGVLVAFVIALITIFRKHWAIVTAPLYALVEGSVLGAVSYMYDVEFQGIVLQAVMITVGIFLAMLVIYLSRIIKVTENIKLGVAAATGGIAFYYIGNLLVNFFGKELPLINSNSQLGIGFSVFVIIVAALNLVCDFDFIEQGVERQAPKYMEWYSGFGLLVTVVWLYLEILRLLAKARSR